MESYKVTLQNGAANILKNIYTYTPPSLPHTQTQVLASFTLSIKIPFWRSIILKVFFASIGI